MAIQMASPGVYVTEIDRSEIVPSTSASVTVFGGDFTKGPVGVHTQITSVDDLIEYYGKPTNDNYNQWYQAYNFLQYGNNLLISRAINDNGLATNLKSEFMDSSDSIGYGILEFGVTGYGTGEDKQVVYVTETDKIKAGDVIVFSDNVINAIDKTKSVRYFVVSTSDTSIKKDGVSIKCSALLLHKNLELPPICDDLDTICQGKNLEDRFFEIYEEKVGSIDEK